MVSPEQRLQCLSCLSFSSLIIGKLRRLSGFEALRILLRNWQLVATVMRLVLGWNIGTS